jgi:hypothetical protein
VGSLLRDDGFRVAVVVAVLGAGFAWWCASRTAVRVPAAAITVVAALAGARAEHSLTFSLVLGLALLGTAAWVTRAGVSWALGGAAWVGGALVLAGALPERVPTWMGVSAAVALVPLAPLIESRARRWGRLAPVVLLGSIAGVYACVPDTEVLRPLLGASAVVAFLALLPDAAVVQVGAGVVAGYTVWISAFESAGRAGALWGAIGCVAALALFPARPELGAPSRSWWIAAATTSLLVVWCARVAGLVDSGWLAAVLVVVGFAVAGVVVLAGEATRRRRRRRS